MKLKSNFILYSLGGEQTLVSVGKAAKKFHGIVKCNKTSAFIVECLKKETTEEEIVNKMVNSFVVDNATAEAGVKKIIDQLRSIEALDE